MTLETGAKNSAIQIKAKSANRAFRRQHGACARRQPMQRAAPGQAFGMAAVGHEIGVEPGHPVEAQHIVKSARDDRLVCRARERAVAAVVG